MAFPPLGAAHVHDWHEGQPCSPTSSSISPHLTLEVGAADMTFRHRAYAPPVLAGKEHARFPLGQLYDPVVDM